MTPFGDVIGILACFAVVVISAMPNDFMMPKDNEKDDEDMGKINMFGPGPSEGPYGDVSDSMTQEFVTVQGLPEGAKNFTVKYWEIEEDFIGDAPARRMPVLFGFPVGFGLKLAADGTYYAKPNGR